MSALLLSSLGPVCPSCDLYNPPGSSRCFQCGTTWAGSPRPTVPATPPTSPRLPAPAQLLPPKPELFPPGMRPAARPAAVRPDLQPAPPQPSPPQPSASRFGLSVISGPHKGQRFRLGGAGCMFGRARGAILFADDPHLSPHHGTLLLKDDRLFIRDEGSLSGVFVAVTRETLSTGSYFAAGSRLFRFQGALPGPEQAPPGKPRAYGAPVPDGQTLFTVEEILVGGRVGRALATPGPLVTIGRQQCDLTFPDDESLAPRHCELVPSDRQAVLKDVSGGAGTWVRIPAGVERALAPGDRFRVGVQTLQVTALA